MGLRHLTHHLTHHLTREFSGFAILTTRHVFDPWDGALVAPRPPRHGGVCSAVEVRLKSIRETG